MEQSEATTILQAIERLEQTNREQFEGLAAQIASLNGTQARQGRRMDELEGIVNGLLHNREAVVQREGRREALYRALDENGLNKNAALRELERRGMLERQPSQKTRTWVHHDPLDGYKSYRTIMIFM